MGTRMEMGFAGAFTFHNVPGHVEHLFFPADDDLIGAGMVRIGVFDHIIRVKVVFQIGIGQRLWIKGKEIFRFSEGLNPARRFVLKVFRRATVTLFGDMLFQGGHKIVSGLVGDACPPAKMIQTVIADVHLFT